MAKYAVYVLRRDEVLRRGIHDSIQDMTEDFSELLDEKDTIEFDTPIHTKGYGVCNEVHGITYMSINDDEGEIIGEQPAFYLGDEHHLEFIDNIPYEVVLNVYRTVFNV